MNGHRTAEAFCSSLNFYMCFSGDFLQSEIKPIHWADIDLLLKTGYQTSACSLLVSLFMWLNFFHETTEKPIKNTVSCLKCVQTYLQCLKSGKDITYIYNNRYIWTKMSVVHRFVLVTFHFTWHRMNKSQKETKELSRRKNRQTAL